ncbi:MAG TPA: tetratricopeptide repeat protein [Bosea sp. (in: a-proteobacteria)]|jgi:DNA-binding SARP family transcriptional activator|uniref:tetratricopeptide repeat protein n=1 Tax=Bosea sp. (in: a-proteobacteria) TaxID=1871050 RepID=UPI002E0F50C2|nr:tetratricopeptide repeat protein [Bosea sp. (in: a-proteobacteria)]
MAVESDTAGVLETNPALQVRLLGPLAIRRNGASLALPRSRKVRALFAYLALTPQPVTRTRLCELLWDVPNDPRGELRWCLSKIRQMVDGPDRQRVRAQADTVWLDLSDCSVDACDIAHASRSGIGTLGPAQAEALAALVQSELLDGLEIERCPAFDNWLMAQRRRFHSIHIALLERLVACGEDQGSGHLERWLELAPFDLRAHGLLLARLARNGQLRDGDDHLAAASRLFEAEGFDAAPLRQAWAAVRTAGADRPPAAAATPADVPEVGAAVGDEGEVAGAARRASIAVMPFTDQSIAAGEDGGAAAALAHDVITRLAKLRSLFVIAQGTVFRLHDRHIGPEQAGRMLKVEYVVSGSLRRQTGRLTITVELAETESGRVVWAEIFNRTADDTFLVLDEIGDRIVASVASEVEAAERNRAILKPPNGLDAWEAHHRGLWHMYRFNQADNDKARSFFERAIRLDPTFARAYAGLSFTHFQNAFQGWTARAPQIDLAFEAAGQSLMVDDRDPAAHWAMGRALWLRGRHDQSVAELEQAIALSPNFAQGHYALAFVHSQAGDAAAAIASSDYSRQLSPFDPMLFGMLGARAMALVRLGRFDEAADWAIKAAARPNAHAQIRAIAALSLSLAGRHDEGQAHLAAIRSVLPHYRIDDFLTAMHFTPEGAQLFRDGGRKIGLD